MKLQPADPVSLPLSLRAQCVCACTLFCVDACAHTQTCVLVKQEKNGNKRDVFVSEKKGERAVRWSVDKKGHLV